MKFEAENKGEWFYFIEEDHDAGGVCLRFPTADEYESIQALTVTEGKPDYHRGVRYPTEKVNKKLALKMSIRKFIVDWKNIQLDGVDVDCTPENISKMIKVHDFQLFVGDCLEKLTDTNKTIEAARVKNLETSVDGDVVPEA